MNKYSEPELICRRFSAEEITTASGEFYSTSVQMVREKLALQFPNEVIESYVMKMGE